MPAPAGQKRKATRSRVTGAKRRIVTKTPMAIKPKPRSLPIRAPKEVALYERILKNPFSVNTPCAFPDMYRGRTTPLLLSQQLAFGKNTAGTHGGLRIEPDISGFWAPTGSGSTMDAIAWNTTLSHTEYSSLSNLDVNLDKYRILAMALKIQYVGNADSLSGTVSHVFSNNPAELSIDANTFPDMHADSGISPITQKGTVFTIRPFDKPVFVDEGSSCNDYISGLTLIVNGVDPDDILVSSRMFIEGVPAPASNLADSAVPSPVSAGGVTVAYNTHAVMEI